MGLKYQELHLPLQCQAEREGMVQQGVSTTMTNVRNIGKSSGILAQESFFQGLRQQPQHLTAPGYVQGSSIGSSLLGGSLDSQVTGYCEVFQLGQRQLRQLGRQGELSPTKQMERLEEFSTSHSASSVGSDGLHLGTGS